MAEADVAEADVAAAEGAEGAGEREHPFRIEPQGVFRRALGADHPRGLLLQWHITERCNLRCAHCYQEGCPGGELPLPDLLRILEQFSVLLDTWRRDAQAGDKAAGRAAGPYGSLPPAPARRRVWGHVTVTGGEPFVRRDFPELLEVVAARRDEFSFAVLTNGTLVDARLARRLRSLGPRFVQVSIEGTPATHDRIRGAGSFERAVSGIRCLVREGVPTLVSFTAHRGNFREFPFVARLARRLRVDRAWADRLIPCGSGSGLREQTLDSRETREFMELMARESADARRGRRSRTEVAMHRALQFLAGGGEPYHCTAGDTLVAVQPNGDLYPCRRLPIRVGNLLETPLLELYERSPLLAALRDPGSTPEGCAGCFHAGACRGGLRCLSHALTGDPFRRDPGCWLAPSKEERDADRQAPLG